MIATTVSLGTTPLHGRRKAEERLRQEREEAGDAPEPGASPITVRSALGRSPESLGPPAHFGSRWTMHLRFAPLSAWSCTPSARPAAVGETKQSPRLRPRARCRDASGSATPSLALRASDLYSLRCCSPRAFERALTGAARRRRIHLSHRRLQPDQPGRKRRLAACRCAFQCIFQLCIRCGHHSHVM